MCTYASSAQPQPVNWPQLINVRPVYLFSHAIQVEYVFSKDKLKNKKIKINIYHRIAVRVLCFVACSITLSPYCMVPSERNKGASLYSEDKSLRAFNL